MLRLEVETPVDAPAGMCHIPAGSFSMGAEGWGPFESPVHEVQISDFYLDTTLVTNAQFAAFVADTDYLTEAEKKCAARGYIDGEYKMIAGLSWLSHFTEGREDHPVVMISWNDAAAYAKWAGKRLPTEAEWEKAARGGLEEKLYPWGNDEADGTQSNFGKTPNEVAPTTAVKSFAPNGYGLYDMVGNTWVWCKDWFNESCYNKDLHNNPSGPETGELRVRRGGSWNVIQPFRLRCANRGAAKPETTVPNIGFRCALDEKLQKQLVDKVLDKIRPAMEADGGGVDLVAVNGGSVIIQLKGMCLDCPSVSMTLRLGIEKTLRQHLSWFEKVVRKDESRTESKQQMVQELDII